MKTKLKKLSKRTVSILLSLLMIVSTITVGIVATNAAFVDSEKVGDGWEVTYSNGDSVYSNAYGKDITIYSSTYNNHLSGNDLLLKFKDEHNNTYGNNENLNLGETVIAGQGANNGVKFVNAKNYTSITFRIDYDNATKITWKSSEGGSSSPPQVVGDVSGDWNTYKDMTKSGDNYYFDVTTDNTYFRFKVGNKVYYPWKTDNQDIDFNLTSSDHGGPYDGSTEAKKYGATETNNGKAFYFTKVSGYSYRIWVNSNKVWIETIASNRTVTFGVCDGQSSMGTVTAKAGDTELQTGGTVASGTSVTFTATPNFGYEFDGWKTAAAGTTAHTYGSTNPKTAAVTENVTVYAKFKVATQDANNPYYLGGRMAIATQSDNIKSSTINKNGVEQYGATLNPGAGLDKSTNTAGPNAGADTNYWSFTEGSTNLPFSLKDGSSNAVGQREYILDTYRTVKQLSEDKDKLYNDYGKGNEDDNYKGRDVYHNPFYFLVHDKLHRLGGSDSSGSNFQNQSSESSALSLEEYTGTGTMPEAREIRFNNYSSQSNGWVRIHLKENGYNPATGEGGTPTIWYEIVDETPPAAATVRISATPARVDRNSTADINVTLKGSYVADSLKAPANSITYTFYKSTDGKTWTQIRAAVKSDTYSYKETATDAAMYYKVTVGSDATTEGGKAYDTRSATTSVEIYSSGTYMSDHISGNTTPAWGSDLSDYKTSNTAYTRTTGATYTNSNPYVFTLSSEKGWDPDYEKYTIDADSNQFCKIETVVKEVTIDEEPATVITYKVTPNVKCTNPTIYVDFKNKKIWAVATLGTIDSTQTYNSDSTKGEQVWYYFAERVDKTTTTNDGDANYSNPGGTDPAGVNGDNQVGMKIYFWNNSLDKGDWRNVVTPANGPTGNNLIYVKTDAFYQNDYYRSGYQYFRVYKVKLPIWATSFKFTNSIGGDITAVPTNKIGNSGEGAVNHSVTLNPNRIYVLYTDKEQTRVKGVVLDDSMYYNTVAKRLADGNEVNTYNVTANLINYEDIDELYNPTIKHSGKTINSTTATDDLNKRLSAIYQDRKTPHSLYFGVFTYNSGDQANYCWWNDNALYYGFGKNQSTANTSGRDWAKNLAMRKDKAAYYASVQNLVGATLTNPSVKANANGFGMLQDTTAALSNGKSTAKLMPLFDYEYINTNKSTLTTNNVVKQGLNFPFYESSYNGITTYSYDSTTDRNRVYAVASGSGTNAKPDRFEVQGTGTDHGFARGNDNGGDGMVTGLFPFGGNNNGKDNTGFGIEFDMNFYMTNTGKLTDKDGNAQDIAFNFSGDDDVWVFVDGVKVLDLGGSHKVSAGTINFSDMKVYYKSSANSIDSVGTVLDTWASKNSDYVKTVDLDQLMKAYGKDFDNTDASTKHTFQMFYMERGALQSNCVVSFNLPQASGLNVKNTVTVDKVNEVLKKAAAHAAASDYFSYSVQSKLVDGALPTDLNSAYNNKLKTPATSISDLVTSTPTYKYPYQTTRVFDVGDTNYPVIRYLLSKQGDTPADETSAGITYSTDWQYVYSTVYTLSESGYAKLELPEGSEHSAVTGKTDTVANKGVFHLLGGEKANFEDKVPKDTYVKVTQTQDLGTVEENGDNPISYKAVANNNTGSYYETYFSVYDEKAKKYVVDKNKFPQHTAANLDFVAADTRTGTDNGFYFSNYSENPEDVNTAMTVEFTNDIAVGTIRVEKELDDLSYSNAKFSFRVKLGRIFGSGEDSLKEYPGLEYTLYNADGTEIGKRYYSSVSGLVLSPGQYALIEGVPVETRFEVEEVPAAGYSFTKLTKTTEKPNGDTVYYDNKVLDSNKYEETVLAPNPSKTTANYIIKEKEGTADEFVIYKNMIPPVSETYVNETSGYVSVSKVLFTNQRETFTITFKYYDRDVTNNVPASISDVVSSYSVTVKDLDKYIYNKGEDAAGYDYLTKLPGIGAVEEDAFVAYNYEKMIKDKTVEFIENTGTGVSNLIDDYRMWTRQSKAVTGLQNLTNLKTGNKYTAAEATYHTTSNGQPNTSGEKWVNYLSNDGTSFDPETVNDANAPFHAGDLSNYENIKSIVVWLYNMPKAYKVNVYGAQTQNDLNEAKDITLQGSGITVSGARVAKLTSTSAYKNVEGYYSQRLGDKKGNDYLDDIAYLKAYGVDACVKKGNDYVRPESKAIDAIPDTNLVFAYWAYDPDGTQVASTDYIFGYRITGSFDLYAVYAPAKLTNAQYGLTITKDADDTYIDSAGNAKVRINTMFNPYNLEDYDVKIKRAAIVNIYVSNLLRQSKTETEIKALMEDYRGQLKDMLASNTFSKLNVVNSDQSLDVQLTTKGYVKLVNSGSSSINLTNKNRIEFTTQFNKSQLYTDSVVGILQVGAMGYDKNGDNNIAKEEWILSDNSILRQYSKS